MSNKKNIVIEIWDRAEKYDHKNQYSNLKYVPQYWQIPKLKNNKLQSDMSDNSNCSLN